MNGSTNKKLWNYNRQIGNKACDVSNIMLSSIAL